MGVAEQQHQQRVSQRSNKGAPPRRLIGKINMFEHGIIESKTSQALKSKKSEQ